MARSRNIKPGFFKNEELVELPFEYRLLFVGLWTLADRVGRLEDRPKRIKMELFPADDVNVVAGIDELERMGFVARYDAEGKKVIEIINFLKHQAPHHTEKKSELPANPRALTVNSPLDTGDAPDIHESTCVDIPLIPDSLIPDSLEEPPIPPKRKRSGGAVELKTFLDTCKTNGKKPIPEDDPVFEYSESVGIPGEWLHLCWREFIERYRDKPKRYKDWRQVFRNAVRANWFRLWYVNPGGEMTLTTQGVLAQKRHDETRRANGTNGSVALQH